MQKAFENFQYYSANKMFEGETFFKSILYKTLVSQTLEATDEVVSIFGCQVMRVALDKNEP